MIRTLLLAFGIVVSLLTGIATALAESATPSPSAGTYAHPEWLASTTWLDDHLGDSNVAIIALTPAKDFEKAHIPGSVQVDWPAFEITETSDQQVASWQDDVETIFTKLGIERDQTVVVYDGGTFYGARLWWLFYQLGHHDVRLLNGGLEAWQADGFAVETGTVDPKPASTPYVGKPDNAAIATIAEVEQAVADDSATFVDARSPKEYADGHLPGAVNVPFTDNAVADGPKYWKSFDDLTSMYTDAGVNAGDAIIPYCSTGVRSAATYFALGLIGYTDVHLFTGSYQEWSADPDRPITKGDRP